MGCVSVNEQLLLDEKNVKYVLLMNMLKYEFYSILDSCVKYMELNWLHL